MGRITIDAHRYKHPPAKKKGRAPLEIPLVVAPGYHPHVRDCCRQEREARTRQAEGRNRGRYGMGKRSFAERRESAAQKLRTLLQQLHEAIKRPTARVMIARKELRQRRIEQLLDQLEAAA